jgi:hypothetical protein
VPKAPKSFARLKTGEELRASADFAGAFFIANRSQHMSQPTILDAPELEVPESAPENTEQPVVKRKKACRECELWDQEKERIRVLELLESAIAKLESRFETKDFKPTVAEYLKLMQMEKDLESEQVQEIKVTWVESDPSPKPAK